jgi:hypothetical protein
LVAGYYTNTTVGGTTYWLNGGQGVGGGSPIQIKATYKISGISNTTFVVSLEQCQPVSFQPSVANQAPYYQVFASQMKFTYNNLDATRWAPSHIGIFSSATFSGCNICISQHIKNSSNTNHT